MCNQQKSRSLVRSDTLIRESGIDMQADHYRAAKAGAASTSEMPKRVLPQPRPRNSGCRGVLILGQQEFALGSHVITPRCGFLHHGIYVGNGRVVHYAGSTHGLLSGPIEEISLYQFTGGRPIWANRDAPAHFCCDEVVRRARSRVGEDQYRLMSNNCEHFCEWCLRAEHRSYQVEAWLSIPRRALNAIIRLNSQFRNYLSAEVTNHAKPF
jgi:hypothetical protein